VRGAGQLFARISDGRNRIFEDGNNRWDEAGENQQHSYLKQTVSDEVLAEIIEGLMIQPPKYAVENV